jgi:hypothetical protein
MIQLLVLPALYARFSVPRNRNQSKGDARQFVPSRAAE